MKESIRDRILLYVYEQKGDKHGFVELNDFLRSLGRTDWDIGQAIRKAAVHGREKPLEIRPHKEAQFLGKDRDQEVTIANTPFQARLTDAGVAEVKRMLAEDTSVQLTKAQLKEFPRMSWQSSWGFWIGVVIAAWTISSEVYRAVQSEKEQSSVSPTVQEQFAPTNAIPSILKLDSVVTETPPLPDTVPEKK